MLKVVAKHADIYNWRGGSLDEFKRKLEVLSRHCATVGRDFGKIEKSYNTEVIIGESEKEIKSSIAKLIRQGVNRWYSGKGKWEPISREKYLGERIVGTPEQCVEQIERIVDLGATYLIFYFPLATENQSYRLFAKKVIPKFSHERVAELTSPYFSHPHC